MGSGFNGCDAFLFQVRPVGDRNGDWGSIRHPSLLFEFKRKREKKK